MKEVYFEFMGLFTIDETTFPWETAPDYKTLLELNSNQILAIGDINHYEWSSTLYHVNTSLRNALVKLNTYGILVLGAQPQLSGQIFPMPHYGPKHLIRGLRWRYATQKPAISLLIPTAHPELPTGSVKRLCERLRHHPDLVVAIQPLSSSVPKDLFLARSWHTPGFSSAESSFYRDGRSAEDVLIGGEESWEVGVVEFLDGTAPWCVGGDVRFDHVSALLEVRPVYLFVTTREWSPIFELFEELERVMGEEGFRRAFSVDVWAGGF
ncbi:hypothetical protein CC78DRAFT_577303 [Lojkania enalia]|uniref:Uncharacterized protein n=1 Tax=Lojkania enalia TaxID=147567 RepID=A0A9P4KER1_9PLEO|nr:hypothetical protein CC78DRAFT_577303 [Didymosphaeria enalia]